MKLINTLEFPDPFLRRLVSWTCKQLGLPVRYIRKAKFRNRYDDWTGVAYGRSFVVSLGRNGPFPLKSHVYRNGFYYVMNDRIEALVAGTAHELGHCEARYSKQDRTRRGGGWGGSELFIDTQASKILDKFRERREALLAEWGLEPTPAAPSEIPPEAEPVLAEPEPAAPEPAAPRRKPSLVERRAAKAEAMLAKWERKLKLAKTKVQAYRRKVRYYERRAAARSGE